MPSTGPEDSLSGLLRSLITAWRDNDLTNVAGAVTFFAVQSLFPFLLFLVALAGLVLDPERIAGTVDGLARVAPGEVTRIVGDRIRSIWVARSAGLAAVGALGALLSASGGMVALMDALNRANGARETRPFVKRRLLALGLTAAAALLSLVAALVALAIAPLSRALGGLAGTLLVWLRLPVAGALMAMLWSVLYERLPDVPRRHRLVTPGAVTGVLAWLAVSWAFSLYVAHFGRFEVTYGTLGGGAVLLLWMWLSTQSLLLGAQLDAILRRRSRTTN